MKLFFKKIGILLVPLILTLLTVLVCDVVFRNAFAILHPDQASRDLYNVSRQATADVVVGVIAVLWVLIPSVTWAKTKIRIWELKAEEDARMRAEAKEEAKNGDPKQREVSTRGIFYKTFFNSDMLLQRWHKVDRVMLSLVGKAGGIYATLNLDFPREDQGDVDSFWKNCNAFIYAFWVFNAARGNGLGDRLLTYAEGTARTRGCKTIGLRWDDRESESWVLEWYKRKGYEEKFTEDDGHSHFLVKKLSDEKDDNPSNDENQE